MVPMPKTKPIFIVHIFMLFFLVVLLPGCGNPHRGAHARKDGPPKQVPAHLMRIPDAHPKVEPLSKYGNRFKGGNTYIAKNKRYRVMPTSKGYRAQGYASWYGTKFHGRRTSSGEPYNMYAMTAAHPTLPLPTYARVTNLHNGKSVVVKINDRGPFRCQRLIDLSYVAAAKLGLLGKGTAPVEVVSIDPRDHGGHPPSRRHPAPPPVFLAENKAALSLKKQSTTRDSAAAKARHSVSTAPTTSMAPPPLPPAKAPTMTALLPPLPEADFDPVPARTESNNTKRVPLSHPIEKKQTYYLQLGSFVKRASAEELIKKIARFSKSPTAIAQSRLKNSTSTPAPYRVRIGPFTNQEEVIQLTRRLAEAKLPQAIVITE
jgi:rare lipoprotein A